jgi:hypothetical protein
LGCASPERAISLYGANKAFSAKSRCFRSERDVGMELQSIIERVMDGFGFGAPATSPIRLDLACSLSMTAH